MTIADKLAYLGDTKQLLRQALEGVGQYIPNDSTTFREYVTKLADSQRTLGLNFTGESYDLLNPINDVTFADEITFTRGSTGAYWDRQGVLQTAAVDEERITHDPSSLNSSVNTFDLDTLVKNDIVTVNLASTNMYNLGDVIGVSDDTTIANHFYALIVEVVGDVLTCQVTSVGGTGSISAWTIIKSEGLLIEEQRTNLLLWSEAFDDPSWGMSNITVSTDAITAPDGTNTADKIVENTNNSNHGFFEIQSMTAGQKILASIHVKAAERNKVRVQLDNTAFDPDARIDIDLTDGSITGTIGGEDYINVVPLPNGWYRIELGATVSTSANGGFALFILESAGTAIYTGDGTSGLYVWGAQLEQGSSPTSYIKTEASQVTRSADNCSRTLGSEYNNSDFTVYCNFDWDGQGSGSRYLWALSQGANNTQTRLALRVNVSFQRVEAIVSVGGTISLVTPVPELIAQMGRNKAALSLSSSGDIVVAVNGQAATRPDPGTFGTADLLTVGSLPGEQLMWNGSLPLIKMEPRALSATELEALTS